MANRPPVKVRLFAHPNRPNSYAAGGRRQVATAPPAKPPNPSRPGRQTTQTPFTLTSLWVQAGGDASIAPVMAAIALAESAGRVAAVGGPNNNGTYDYGLWQINSSHGYNQSQLTSDPLYNARAAVAIYKSQGLAAWSTYNNGAYKKFIGQNASVPSSSGSAGNRPGATPRTRPGGQTAGQSSGGDVTSIMSDWSDALAGTQNATFDVSDPTNQDVLFGIPSPHALAKALSGAIGDTKDFFKVIIWIVNPINILRMVEMLIGLALMAFGFQAMLQAYGESKEGFITSEGALSRSGLGRVSREVSHAAKSAAKTGKDAAELAVAPEVKGATAAKGAKGAKGAGGGKKFRIKPEAAPHRTRRQALRLRYEREKAVSNRRADQRRSGG